jgi:hypothetical protein
VSNIFKLVMTPEDLHRGTALVILWAYGYQLVLWPMLFYASVIATAHGLTWPAPVIVPWEQLMAGTTTLAAVSGIAAWKDKETNRQHEGSNANETGKSE